MSVKIRFTESSEQFSSVVGLGDSGLFYNNNNNFKTTPWGMRPMRSPVRRPVCLPVCQSV